MNDSVSEQNLAEDHKRFKKLVSSTIKAFFLSVVIGLIGGYAMYQMMPAGKFPVALLYIPGIIAVIFTCLPIRKRKNEWFPTPESLKAASEYKPPED